MAVAYRSSSASGASDAFSESCTVPVPPNARPGDIALLAVERWGGTNPAITWPSGFTPFVDEGVGEDQKLHVAWKRLDGADSGDYVVSWTGDQWNMGHCVLLDGAVSSGNPIQDVDIGTATQSGDTDIPLPDMSVETSPLTLVDSDATSGSGTLQFSLPSTEGNLQAIVFGHRTSSLSPSIDGDGWSDPYLVETEIADTNARRAIVMYWRVVPPLQSGAIDCDFDVTTGKAGVAYEFEAGGAWSFDQGTGRNTNDNGVTETDNLASDSVTPEFDRAVALDAVVTRHGLPKDEDSYSDSFITGEGESTGTTDNTVAAFSGYKIVDVTPAAMSTTASWVTLALATSIIATWSVEEREPFLALFLCNSGASGAQTPPASLTEVQDGDYLATSYGTPRSLGPHSFTDGTFTPDFSADVELLAAFIAVAEEESAATVWDSFTDDDETSLADHDPDVGGSGVIEQMPWQIGGTSPPASSDVVIRGNSLQTTAASSADDIPAYRYNVDPGSDEYDVEVFADFRSATQNTRWPVVLLMRMTPSPTTAHGSMDYYYFLADGDNDEVALGKVVAGAFTELESDGTTGWVGTVRDFRVEVRSGGISVFADETLVLSTTDTDITQRGRVGIQARRSNDGDQFADDLVVTPVSFSSNEADMDVASPAATASFSAAHGDHVDADMDVAAAASTAGFQANSNEADLGATAHTATAQFEGESDEGTVDASLGAVGPAATAQFAGGNTVEADVDVATVASTADFDATVVLDVDADMDVTTTAAVGEFEAFTPVVPIAFMHAESAVSVSKWDAFPKPRFSTKVDIRPQRNPLVSRLFPARWPGDRL